MAKKTAATRSSRRKPIARQPQPPPGGKGRLKPAPAVTSPSFKGRDLMIVGVGASAGGLEAFTQLLHGLPDDAGLAVVFVQHLAPQHDSALVPLLSGQTKMPVIQVTEGLRVEANRVYVIP